MTKLISNQLRYYRQNKDKINKKRKEMREKERLLNGGTPEERDLRDIIEAYDTSMGVYKDILDQQWRNPKDLGADFFHTWMRYGAYMRLNKMPPIVDSILAYLMMATCQNYYLDWSFKNRKDTKHDTALYNANIYREAATWGSKELHKYINKLGFRVTNNYISALAGVIGLYKSTGTFNSLGTRFRMFKAPRNVLLDVYDIHPCPYFSQAYIAKCGEAAPLDIIVIHSIIHANAIRRCMKQPQISKAILDQAKKITEKAITNKHDAINKVYKGGNNGPIRRPIKSYSGLN